LIIQYPIVGFSLEKATLHHSPLSHHFREILKAELEPQIPADAEDDDLPVEMAALEKIINAQHPGSLSPKTSFRQICPLLPFAPEPNKVSPESWFETF
jgi:hypothetical protein